VNDLQERVLNTENDLDEQSDLRLAVEDRLDSVEDQTSSLRGLLESIRSCVFSLWQWVFD